MKITATKNSFFIHRIENFLAFKGLDYTVETTENISTSPQDFFTEDENIFLTFKNGEKYSGSVHILREIEENFPHPIGFIGPIEPRFQWAIMAITALPEMTPETLEPIFEEIINQVEDEFFIMGPTFSVADCVLMGDLKSLEQENFLLPSEIKSYIRRVEKFLRLNP